MAGSETLLRLAFGYWRRAGMWTDRHRNVTLRRGMVWLGRGGSNALKCLSLIREIALQWRDIHRPLRNRDTSFRRFQADHAGRLAP
jgi:hypothetical protein